MILVDIRVPALDQCFDFELNEEMQAGELLQKVKELLADKIKNIKECEESLYFFAFYKEKLLDETLSLKEQGVVTGERLFLI